MEVGQPRYVTGRFDW